MKEASRQRIVRLTVYVFQAEDGIRDYKVTGVQTCALPIWLRHLGPVTSDTNGRSRSLLDFRNNSSHPWRLVRRTPSAATVQQQAYHDKPLDRFRCTPSPKMTTISRQLYARNRVSTPLSSPDRNIPDLVSMHCACTRDMSTGLGGHGAQGMFRPARRRLARRAPPGRRPIGSDYGILSF